ncbi:MFS transporter [Phytoactinopolyspora alkaliphila]|uniref:MFS transporter n=1 Tax=Phytoactinopolyspora alkaliphila TaxID=1783498 RepID=A0A6N9YIS7_9ACTN|nr:MFS transporter [Phytoactinopolyspora alkaliphila]NED94862.1 MFS transporter [Phytoactinopolyspora alkaliphila]
MARSDTPLVPPAAHVLRARNAVSMVFAANGFAFASWMARVPQVRDGLGLEPGELGRLLLAIAIGAVIALPTAGLVIGRIGATRTVALGSALAGSGLILASIGADPMVSVAVTALGLAALGYGSGSWDVAMNVEGAAVERLLGRTVMPRFHAAFSLGTVIGAGIGAAVTWLEISVATHLVTVGVVAIGIAMVSTRYFLPRQVEVDDDGVSRPSFSVLLAWREPRTLMIGVMVLSFALIEGIANDWLAVGIVDGYEVENAVGAAAFALFVTAMTVGRLCGSWFLDRYGRPLVVRISGTLAAVGALMVVFGGNPAVAVVGISLWGLGAALGFPVGMSAGADDPRRAAARVSVVASIGYTAFLAGPPLLGWIGDHEGILRALLVVVAAGALGAVVASASRKEEPMDSAVDS